MGLKLKVQLDPDLGLAWASVQVGVGVGVGLGGVGWVCQRRVCCVGTAGRKGPSPAATRKSGRHGTWCGGFSGFCLWDD